MLFNIQCLDVRVHGDEAQEKLLQIHVFPILILRSPIMRCGEAFFFFSSFLRIVQ